MPLKMNLSEIIYHQVLLLGLDFLMLLLKEIGSGLQVNQQIILIGKVENPTKELTQIMLAFGKIMDNGPIEMVPIITIIL